MADFLAQHSALIGLAIITLVFIAFAIERYPPEVVAVGGAVAFLLCGYVKTEEIASVFSNPAPITIAAMFVLSGTLVRTGLLDAAASWLVSRAASRPAAALVATAAGVIFASAFINNTPVVIVLIPIAIEIARTLNIAETKLLMPLSFVTILGGTCSMIGTSTNLLVDGVARGQGLEPFTIFEITPVGIVTAVVGLLYLALVGWRLLPSRDGVGSKLSDGGEEGYFTEVVVREGANAVGKPLGEVGALSARGIRPVAVRRGAETLRRDLAEVVLQKADRIIMYASPEEILTLRASDGFRIARSQPVRPGEERIVVEATVAPHRRGIGRGAFELSGLSGTGTSVLGVQRHRHVPGPSLQEVRLRPADRLLLEGPVEAIARISDENDLVGVNVSAARRFRREKAPLAIAALALVILVSAFGLARIQTAAFVAIAAILLLRVIDADEAWRTIRGDLLILIFAMLAIGTGMEKAGTAQMLVDAFTPLIEHAPYFVVLLVVYGLSSFLTEIVTNNAVAVIVTPIAVALATKLGVDPRGLVVAVMFGASASFATPIGYQTNTLVYAAGNYRFIDFIKVGLPMNIIVGIATTIAIYFYYGS
ncbi:SLC13 family permease [Jiella sonneratiae]|uniref:SLC13 family permease n=1 Tax=Jiella sonneratiae TaxID=2816856 RepID=A0ABS3J137_9HYPH|nr:SLC13 family permease [Jiella sonneratiae]MBO0902797.1 SLC13 family permease [Jiella sonneratiae]